MMKKIGMLFLLAPAVTAAQVDTSEWMVTIDNYVFVADFQYGNDQHFTIRTLCVKLISNRNLAVVLEHGLGHLLQHGFIAGTITLFRRD